MKKNLSQSGRLFRLLIAILLLSYAVWQKSWIAGAVSVFVFYEALAGWCVYYQLIGKNTCRLSENGSSFDVGEDKFIKFMICQLLCLGVGFTASWFTQESVSSWYLTLKKPEWTPPDIVFPIVWTMLYVMMGTSLWIITIRPASNKMTAYIVFSAQLFLNFAWTWLFFFLKEPFYAFIDLGLLIAFITLTISVFWKTSVLAGLLLFPYLAWVAFAASINLYILFLN